jgi:hypothetical protein
MRDPESIILGIKWGAALATFAVIVWVVRNLNIFPAKRLRNLRFGEIKIGQVFYDYGGEESKLREYIKTGELEARCLSIPGHPIVGFDGKNVVKIEVETLKR